MGDVADILGLGDGSKGDGGGARKNAAAKKPDGMSREVFALLGPASSSSLPSMVPATRLGELLKRKDHKVHPWVWAEFVNPARADGVKLKHWQRQANLQQQYAFSRFNKKTAVVKYSEEEYDNVVRPQDEQAAAQQLEQQQQEATSKPWTKEETDELFRLSEELNLRWYVMEDRWPLEQARSTTEMKARYYAVAKAVLQARRSKKAKSATAAAAAATAPSEAAEPASRPTTRFPETAVVTAKATAMMENALVDFAFDEAHERKRVRQLSVLFSRTQAEEKEEANLVNEIRRIDLQLRRLHKELPRRGGAGGGGAGGAGGSGAGGNGAGSGAAGATGGGAPLPLSQFPPSLMEQVLSGNPEAYVPPPPAAGTVTLRSARLRVMPSQIGIGSKIHGKMDALLTELGVPLRPVPTTRVCNAFDKLRQDSIKLLALQSKLFDAKAELARLQGLPVPLRPGQSRSRNKKKQTAAVNVVAAAAAAVKGEVKKAGAPLKKKAAPKAGGTAAGGAATGGAEVDIRSSGRKRQATPAAAAAGLGVKIKLEGAETSKRKGSSGGGSTGEGARKKARTTESAGTGATAGGDAAE